MVSRVIFCHTVSGVAQAEITVKYHHLDGARSALVDLALWNPCENGQIKN